MKIGKKIVTIFLCVLLAFTVVQPASLKARAYSTAYPNTWVNTGNQIEDLIGVAMTQVGYYGNTSTGTKYGAWYGMTYQQWCAMFVSWCANQAGIPTSVIHKNAKANNFRLSGTYHYKSGYVPKRGDLVLYNPMTGGYSGSYYWPDKNADGTYKSSSHVAIVCSYDASTGKIWVVHGNSTGDKVCYNSISVSSNAIQAFVTPFYTTGESSGPAYDYVNGTNVNMRSGPGTSYDKIAQYNIGTYVEILESAKNSSGEIWYKVKVIGTGTVGYIISDYITIVPKEEKPEEEPEENIPATPIAYGYVNGSNVRLRSGPSTSDNILGKFDEGTKVEILDTVKNSSGETWYKLKITDTAEVGYIRNDLVTVEETKTSITVSYNLNGGSGEIDAQTTEDGNIILSDSVPEREGYYFLGWSDTQQGEAKYLSSNSYTFSASLTLYAVWKEYILGDCDLNGTVNASDLAVMKIALSSSEEISSAADINSDGSVNAADLAILKLLLAGG